MRIVISEFMDEAAVAALAAHHATLYDPGLVDRFFQRVDFRVVGNDAFAGLEVA